MSSNVMWKQQKEVTKDDVQDRKEGVTMSEVEEN